MMICLLLGNHILSTRVMCSVLVHEDKEGMVAVTTDKCVNLYQITDHV